MRNLMIAIFFFPACAQAQINTPKDIPNLQAWFVADSQAAVDMALGSLTDGADIDTVRDYSGNNKHLWDSNCTNCTGTVTWEQNENNNHHAYHFAGAAALEATNIADWNFLYQNDMSIALVLSLDDTTGIDAMQYLFTTTNSTMARGIWTSADNVGTNRLQLFYQVAASPGTDPINYHSADGFFPDQQWLTLIITWDAVDSSNPDDFKTIRDGTIVDEVNNAAFPEGGNANFPLHVGTKGTSGSDFLHGHIAEIALYSKELTSTEVTDLQNYFESKYTFGAGGSSPVQVSRVRRRGLRRVARY